MALASQGNDCSDELQQRDDLVASLSFVANLLLGTADWHEALGSVLEQAGRAVGASRACFFEAYNRVSDGEFLVRQLAAWIFEGLRADVNDTAWNDLPLVESGLGRWLEQLDLREPVVGLISELPAIERGLLEAQQVQSLVVMPVFSAGRLYGFLRFDDCGAPRKWSTSERDAISAVAAVMGAAIDRQLLESQVQFAHKMEAIGTLTSGVAHDFNNLLHVITTLTQLALKRLSEKDSPREELESVLGASRHATELARQLLVVARKQGVQPQSLDLGDVCESVLRMLRPSLSFNTTLTKEITRPSPIVDADEGLLSHVLLNLCLNAIDAMPDGGQLSVACQATTLSVEDAKRIPNAGSVDYALLTVRDNGRGMDGVTLARVFEPFFTTKGAGAGTGLGLPLAHTTITQFGGFIDVESKLGQGSEFRVYLPRVAGISRVPAE
ncbi:MAG: ATP-binding protein [Planctomycetota bacterium]